MESPTQQGEAEPLSWEKPSAAPEGRQLTAMDTRSQLDEDHVCVIDQLAPFHMYSDTSLKHHNHHKLCVHPSLVL